MLNGTIIGFCSVLRQTGKRLGSERVNRELKQLWRRRQPKPHKFTYLTMKNNSFARFARAFFIFWHFEDVLVLSTTWNNLFCSCVDDVNIWWQMLNFVLLCPKCWFQFNSRIVRAHFSSRRRHTRSSLVLVGSEMCIRDRHDTVGSNFISVHGSSE